VVEPKAKEGETEPPAGTEPPVEPGPGPGGDGR
jgi:hypothetical protein